MKRFLLSFLIICLLGPVSEIRGLDIVTDMSLLRNPEIKVAYDDMGISVEYQFMNVLQTEDSGVPGSYYLQVPGFAVEPVGGEPALLQRWDTFEIPERYEAQVILESISYLEEDIRLAASSDPLADNGQAAVSDDMKSITPYTGWKPESPVTDGGIQIYRDRNLLRVGVHPVSYSYSSGKARIAESLSYRIAFVPLARAMSEIDDTEIMRHEVDDDIMAGMLTYPMVEESEEVPQALPAAPAWEEGEWYLIITTPMYSPALSDFVEWKKKLGFNVKVKAQTGWTVSQVRSAIKSEYESNPRLEYVLIIGSALDVPPMKKNLYKECDTDYLYACMDGDNDYTADVAIGRLPVVSIEEAKAVLQKIRYCERDKRISNRVLHCAEFQDTGDYECEIVSDTYEDRRYVRTSEDIADAAVEQGYNVERVYYYSGEKTNSLNKPLPSFYKPQYWNNEEFGYGESMPNFLKASDFNWSGIADDIIPVINRGVNYVFHRGHGDSIQWSLPNFTVSDVSRLNNYLSTPVVFSINCKTGYYGNPQSCTGLAEALIRKMSGGASCVIAATEDSFSGYNDVMIVELFQALWPKANTRHAFPHYMPLLRESSISAIRQIGQLLNVAKVRLGEAYYPNSDDNNYTKILFQCFGDPGMELQEFIQERPVVDCELTMVNPNAWIYTLDAVLSTKTKWVRINNTTGLVETYANRKMSVSNVQLSSYRHYLTSSSVPPQPIEQYINSNTTGLVNEIESVSVSGEMLYVKYRVESGMDSRIHVSNILTGETYAMPIDCTETEVSVPMAGYTRGMYSVTLSVDGCMEDVKKVTYK